MSKPDAYNPFARIYHQHWSDFSEQIWPSLNHILEWEDLKQTFCNVHQALKPGGWFFST